MIRYIPIFLHVPLFKTVERTSESAGDAPDNSTAKLNSRAAVIAIALVAIGLVTTISLGPFQREYRLRFWEKFRLNGEMEFLQRDFKEAEHQHAQALDQARALGTEDFRVGLSLEDLARTYAAAAAARTETAAQISVRGSAKQEAEAQAQDYYSLAKQNYLAAIASFEKHLKTATAKMDLSLCWQHLARSLTQLASVLMAQGDLAQSQQYYERAQSMYKEHEKDVESDHLLAQDFAEADAGLGRIYQKQRKSDKALPLYSHALSLAERSSLPTKLTERIKSEYAEVLVQADKAGLAQTLIPSPRWARFSDQGEDKRKANQLGASEQAYAMALAEAERISPNDIRVAATLGKLGDLHIFEDKLDQARTELQRALSIFEHARIQNEDSITALYDLGLVYWRLGKYDAAEPLLIQFIQSRAGVNRIASKSFMDANAKLAFIYLKSGKKDLAKPLVARTFEAMINDKKPRYMYIGLGIMLGDELAALGDRDKAELSYQHALYVSQKRANKDEPQVLLSLARFYENGNDLQNADAFYKKAVGAERNVVKDEGEDREPFEAYAKFLRANGRASEAAAYEKEASRIKPAKN